MTDCYRRDPSEPCFPVFIPCESPHTLRLSLATGPALANKTLGGIMQGSSHIGGRPGARPRELLLHGTHTPWLKEAHLVENPGPGPSRALRQQPAPLTNHVSEDISTFHTSHEVELPLNQPRESGGKIIIHCCFRPPHLEVVCYSAIR